MELIAPSSTEQDPQSPVHAVRYSAMHKLVSSIDRDPLDALDALEAYLPAALSTARPNGVSLQYCLPAIVGELGECFGAVSKSVRDEWTATDLSDALTLELGDVFWPTAILIHTLSHPEPVRFAVGGDLAPGTGTTGRAAPEDQWDTINAAVVRAAFKRHPAMEALGSLIQRAEESVSSAREELLPLLMEMATGLLLTSEEDASGLLEQALDLWTALYYAAPHIAEADPCQVLAHNVVKLHDRDTRGTISGSGDYR